MFLLDSTNLAIMFDKFWIYYMIFFWVIITGLMFKNMNLVKIDYAKKIIFAMITYIPMAIIVAFRPSYIGADTGNYIRECNNVIYGIGSYFEVNERGFVYLLKLFIYLGFDTADELLAIIGFITVIGYGIFLYRNSPDFYMSTMILVAIGCVFDAMNICRHCLALSIALLGMDCLIRDKKCVGALILLFACTVHNGMIILLPFLFVDSLKKVMYTSGIMLCGAFYIGYFDISKLFELLIGFEIKYASYIDSSHDVLANHSAGGYINILMLLACVVVALMMLRNNNVNNKVNNKVVIYSILAVIIYIAIYIMCTQFAIFARLGVGVYIFECILLPIVFNKFKYYSTLITPLFIVYCFIVCSMQFWGDSKGLGL